MVFTSPRKNLIRGRLLLGNLSSKRKYLSIALVRKVIKDDRKTAHFSKIRFCLCLEYLRVKRKQINVYVLSDELLAGIFIPAKDGRKKGGQSDYGLWTDYRKIRQILAEI